MLAVTFATLALEPASIALLAGRTVLVIDFFFSEKKKKKTA
jgi:hypothetical protein